ncbi:hypothetical protein NDN11_10370 [Acinetobacter sp. C26M]|uniref:hypothetical protein n=1 Tax=unclassified Acinetobacter TaxID=196816 RepID=UPI001422E04D|nr:MULTISPECIES: hypothetical protein [unclassified Acinetobacter]NIE95512.1 hypothetical protein [Acinetobacter sp. Tr-809]USA48316.1 hypothetical protein NDN11_10370 [Acinetobacter sp. C26M]USA51803.1 hypothetical protein NDN12_10370 [Acinetobacter sp. C26G]
MFLFSISCVTNAKSFKDDYINLSDVYFKSIDEQIQFEYGLRGKVKSKNEQLEAKQKECLVEKSKVNLHKLIIEHYLEYQGYMQDAAVSVMEKNEFNFTQNEAQKNYAALKNELKQTRFPC